jgi:hypothetical protein
MQELVEKHPEEIELLLLKALVESWIYNLDVSEYYDLANDSFALAIELAPQDYRGLWFRGMHKVRAIIYIEGYPDLLEVYRQFPHEELDAYFWFDMAYASKEREDFYSTANIPEYHDKTPDQTVASLLEQGSYLGSESTLYHILGKRSALQRRGENKA